MIPLKVDNLFLLYRHDFFKVVETLYFFIIHINHISTQVDDVMKMRAFIFAEVINFRRLNIDKIFLTPVFLLMYLRVCDNTSPQRIFSGFTVI